MRPLTVLTTVDFSATSNAPRKFGSTTTAFGDEAVVAYPTSAGSFAFPGFIFGHNNAGLGKKKVGDTSDVAPFYSQLKAAALDSRAGQALGAGAKCSGVKPFLEIHNAFDLKVCFI